MYKILAVDGGGMRGVIPATILAALEKKKKKPVSDMFDMLIGTSTGAILAAGLCVPNTAGTGPKYKASTLLKFYEKHGSEIFDRSFVHEIPFLGQLAGAFDEVYDHEPLERILKRYFKDAPLSSCLKPLVVTSYDIRKREAYFFKSHYATNNSHRDHLLRDVVRATTAAPTFFEPSVVSSKGSPPIDRVLIDGGVVAGNPAVCGYIEAISKLGASPEEIVLVSLGTGIATHQISYSKAKGWGKLGWAREIVGIFMDGSSDAVEHQMSQLLPGVKAESDQRYFRFDIKLNIGYDALDNTDKTNLVALKRKANEILRVQKSEFQRLLNLV